MYHGEEIKRKTNPRLKANIISVITFFFAFKLVRKGFKRDITEDDIYEVLPKFKSSEMGDELEEQWYKQQKEKSKLSIYRVLWMCYGKYYLFLGVIKIIIQIASVLICPKALSKLISYFTAKTTLDKEDAVYYATILIAVNIMECTYNHYYSFLIIELGIKMKTAFCSLIYRKCLKLSASSVSSNGIGKIVTLISKDVTTFEHVITFLNNIWIGAIIIVATSGVMYAKIGVSALAGVSLLLVVLPLLIYLGTLTSTFRLQAAQSTDQRLQLSQEAISSIKTVKMYSWEDYFNRKILQARKNEMAKIRMYYFARAAFTEIGEFVILFTWYIVITTYTGVGNILTAEVAFFLKACLNHLRSPVTINIPLGILKISEMSASVQRIYKLLTSREHEDKFKTGKEYDTIELRNVSVKVNDVVVLKDVSIEIRTGLNVITGKLGSGKSLLLQTILKTYSVATGEINVSGTISYAGQNTWLFPSTIKQNILFGQKFNYERYERVLKICGLETDIKCFKKEDETVLDDRGRNLSKGQQAKISLARALYCDSSIYLIDDCLSSLDVDIQKTIVTEIKNFFKNKIVVLVCNDKNFVSEGVNVFLVEDGTVKRVRKPAENDTARDNNIIDNILIDSDKPGDLYLQDCKPHQNIYHETVKEGKVDFKAYRKYCKYGGGLFIFVWILLLYGATQFGISLSHKSSSRWVNIQQNISDYQNNTKSSTYQTLLIADQQALSVYSLAISSSVVFLVLRTYAHFSFSAKVSLTLHKTMASSVINATMKFFDGRYFGNILNRFSKDLQTIDELLPFTIHECIKFLCKLAGIMILIATVNVYFLIPSLIFFMILFVMLKFYIPTGRSLKRLESATRSPLLGHINATIEGLPIIQTSKVQNILRKEFDRHQDLYTSTFYMMASAERVFAYALDMLSNFFLAALIIRFLISDRDTQAGSVGLVISQAYGLRGLLQWGIRQWALLENYMTGVERVLEFTDIEKEDHSGQILDKSFGKITYDHVSLKYHVAKDYVLKNLNFTIHSGEKIGIVGRTGVGKSSLVSILFRLYQYEGTISINNININNIALDFLRSNIIIISQDPIIFNGTVRTNIDPTGCFEDREFWKAIKIANLDEIIPSLDYEIADNGWNLSSGQKQLICLVRALMNKKQIVILDEATAFVDLETHAIICKTIREHFKECTVLTIAHKLDTVLNCDKIMVISNGEVVEFDSPNALIQRRDTYLHQMMLLSNTSHKKCQ